MSSSPRPGTGGAVLAGPSPDAYRGRNRICGPGRPHPQADRQPRPEGLPMKWSTVLAVSLVGGLFLRGEVRANPPRPEPVRVSVEAGKTGEPISKYIYGQFIEHL